MSDIGASGIEIDNSAFEEDNDQPFEVVPQDTNQENIDHEGEHNNDDDVKNSPQPASNTENNTGYQKKLYVSNLPYKMNDADLADYFSQCGEVLKTHVMRKKDGKSRGIAFVFYKNPEDSLKAISKLNGNCIDGRYIAIDFSNQDDKDFGERIYQKRVHHHRHHHEKRDYSPSDDEGPFYPVPRRRPEYPYPYHVDPRFHYGPDPRQYYPYPDPRDDPRMYYRHPPPPPMDYDMYGPPKMVYPVHPPMPPRGRRYEYPDDHSRR